MKSLDLKVQRGDIQLVTCEAITIEMAWRQREGSGALVVMEQALDCPVTSVVLMQQLQLCQMC
ncbi:hypothetical protein EYF80_001832 [Liparis tanakae]|uniref:Uncharacterized protein n=1 Tax=Liparis tanakae TaxID=230148 RepID=A0A4Z2JDY4_9TELE|nr:hypothetical protein EYF80_001832 [Liparis tanakae]